MLYHLAPVPAWEAAQAAGTPYKPATYDADGFTHLTSDPAKLIPVGNAFYKASKDDWVLLCLNEENCGDVRLEPAAPVGETQPSAEVAGADGGALFPHLYGPILHESVVAVHPVARGPDGEFLGVDGVTR